MVDLIKFSHYIQQNIPSGDDAQNNIANPKLFESLFRCVTNTFISTNSKTKVNPFRVRSKVIANR